MNLSILSRYLLKTYLERFLMVLLVVCIALIFSNIFDILNKTRGISLSQNVFLNLLFLKMPYLIAELLPIITMLSMFIMSYIFSKHGELAAIWCNGNSIFSILLPISLCAFLIGVFSLAFLNPIYTHMLAKHENIQSKLVNHKPYSVVLSSRGIIISERIEDYKRIYIVKSLDVQNNSMQKISALLTDGSNNYLGRINAESAKLGEKSIMFSKVVMYDEDGHKAHLDQYQLPTTLSIENFVEGIKPPHDLNFWALSDAIHNLKLAGLPIVKHQIYLYKLLFRPLSMVSLILFAACFISVDNRSRDRMPRTILGIFSGFVIYLFSQTFGNILAFSGVNPMMAMALPTLILILLSCFAILHLRID